MPEIQNIIWDSKEAQELAKSAYIDDWRIREFVGHGSHCTKITLDDVKNFLIFKGTNACIAEHIHKRFHFSSNGPPQLQRQSLTLPNLFVTPT